MGDTNTLITKLKLMHLFETVVAHCICDGTKFDCLWTHQPEIIPEERRFHLQVPTTKVNPFVVCANCFCMVALQRKLCSNPPKCLQILTKFQRLYQISGSSHMQMITKIKVICLTLKKFVRTQTQATKFGVGFSVSKP